MTLDEAIKHCEEVAEWLKELKKYREVKGKMENNAKKLHFFNNQTIMGLLEVITDEDSD